MENKKLNVCNGSYKGTCDQAISSKDTSSLNVHINPKMINVGDKLNANQHNYNNAISSNVHVNPNFLNGKTTLSSALQSGSSFATSTTSGQDKNIQPHINPAFISRNKNLSANILDADINTTSLSVHINPNFVGRKLPSPPMLSKSHSKLSNVEQESKLSSIYSEEPFSNSRPHINPKFVDALKTKAYEDTIKRVVKDKDYLNQNNDKITQNKSIALPTDCLLYTSPSPRDS